jgi:hypothetical protein
MSLCIIVMNLIIIIIIILMAKSQRQFLCHCRHLDMPRAWWPKNQAGHMVCSPLAFCPRDAISCNAVSAS